MKIDDALKLANFDIRKGGKNKLLYYYYNKEGKYEVVDYRNGYEVYYFELEMDAICKLTQLM